MLPCWGNNNRSVNLDVYVESVYGKTILLSAAKLDVMQNCWGGIGHI